MLSLAAGRAPSLCDNTQVLTGEVSNTYIRSWKNGPYFLEFKLLWNISHISQKMHLEGEKKKLYIYIHIYKSHWILSHSCWLVLQNSRSKTDVSSRELSSNNNNSM